MPIKRSAYLQTCLILILVAAQPCFAGIKNTLFTADYQGEFSGWNIKVTRRLTEQDGVYQFESESKNLFASMREVSEFVITDQQIIPRSYEYRRRVFGRQKSETIAFDWDTKLALYRRSDRPKSSTQHPLTGPTLDPSLYQLQLQADIANGVTDLSYSFIKRKKQHHYAFRRGEEDRFKLDKVNRNALIVERVGQDQGESTRVWMLPELGAQIAKIVHQDDDGDTFEIDLAHYESDSVALQDFYHKLKTSAVQPNKALPPPPL